MRLLVVTRPVQPPRVGLGAAPRLGSASSGRDTAPGLPGFNGLLRYRLARGAMRQQQHYLCQMEAATLHGQAAATCAAVQHPRIFETMRSQALCDKAKCNHTRALLGYTQRLGEPWYRLLPDPMITGKPSVKQSAVGVNPDCLPTCNYAELVETHSGEFMTFAIKSLRREDWDRIYPAHE